VTSRYRGIIPCLIENLNVRKLGWLFLWTIQIIRDIFLILDTPIPHVSFCDIALYTPTPRVTWHFHFFPKKCPKTCKNRPKCKKRLKNFKQNVTWYFGKPHPHQECHVIFEWTLTEDEKERRRKKEKKLEKESYLEWNEAWVEAQKTMQVYSGGSLCQQCKERIFFLVWKLRLLFVCPAVSIVFRNRTNPTILLKAFVLQSNSVLTITVITNINIGSLLRSYKVKLQGYNESRL